MNLDKVKEFGKQHVDDILTGLTIPLIIATGISAYKAGPKVTKVMEHHRKAMDALDDKADEIKEEKYKVLKRHICAQTVEDLAPAVLPPIIFGTLTAAAAIGSNRYSSRKVAAITAAYEITRTALHDYKDEIKKIVPKKAEEIGAAVVQKHTREEPIPSDNYIYSTGRGDVLCKDIYTKVYFRSSFDEVQKAINSLSAKVRAETWMTLSDLYYELGVSPDKIPPVASDIGWHDSDLIEGNLPIVVHATLDDTGTIPVLGLDYEVDPFFKEGGRFR